MDTDLIEKLEALGDDEVFHLMVALDIAVRQFPDEGTSIAYGPKTDAYPEGYDALEHWHDNDRVAASRRAILRVACTMTNRNAPLE